MMIISTRGADKRAVAEAVAALRDGKIVIYPTDTLYALGCDALNNRAVEQLCRIKGINPDKNLLTTICADISQAAEYARIDNRAFRMLKEYLPGPVTFVLPAASTLPKVFKGRRTVGIRIPDNDFAVALARELGNPVMSTSVKVDDDDEEAFGTVDPSEIVERYSAYPAVSVMIDAGPGGKEAGTVVDLLDSSDPQLLRQGRLRIEGLE